MTEKAEDSSIVLTEQQKQEIVESKKEISKGLFIQNNDLDKDIQEWLNKK